MRILFIGATSYVASYATEEFLRRGWEVCAVARDSVRQQILSASFDDRVSWVRPADVRSLGSVDAIVNFAFPRDLGLAHIHAATRRLVDTMVDAARHLHPRLVIQVSTKAVFGYTPARSPRPVPVRWAMGDGYVETKALAEWLFMRKSHDAPYASVVLRLGNVIGPGSSWVAELARRVLFERPIGLGHSNATYVRNVADYLHHLAAADGSRLKAFGPFHHLAELSSYPWSSLARPIADALGVQPVFSGTPAVRSGSGLRESANAIARYVSMGLPDSARERVEGLHEWARQFLSGRRDAVGDGSDLNPALHQSLEFRSHLLVGWTPPYDLRSSVEEVLAWVRAAGYPAMVSP